MAAPPGAPRFRLGFLTHVQGRGGSSATYRHAQELFVIADELGFDVGWVAQHHVPLGGGGLPSPWTFLAHAAARTKRIRLATAITILPLEHPLRLAQDISVVDTLSEGRVELGVGSGYGPVEYAAFGADFDDKRQLTTDRLDIVRRALANQEVGTEPAAPAADRPVALHLPGQGQAGCAGRSRRWPGRTPGRRSRSYGRGFAAGCDLRAWPWPR